MVITNPDLPARSPDKQLVSSRPDCSPDLAKSNGLTRTHVSSLSNGSNGDVEYLEQRKSATNSSAPLTNGEANDDFNESVSAENKNINRSNSKSLTGGRDTSRKGRDGDKKSDKDAGKDNLSLVIKLESDVKRLKCDLQLSRNRENELRDQIVSYMSSKYQTITRPDFDYMVICVQVREVSSPRSPVCWWRSPSWRPASTR